MVKITTFKNQKSQQNTKVLSKRTFQEPFIIKGFFSKG